MGDKQDGFALFGQFLHDFHQLFDFLRREHSGRLVEDEHLVIAVEHLENLGALLHADGDILHHRIGIDLQPIALAQLHHLFARLRLLQEAERRDRRFHAEDDVIQHGKHIHEFEVLVHHADAQRVGVVRVFDMDYLPVFADFALFRLIHAKEHAHQGGFARAVFAQQRVNLAFFELKGDIVVGDNARKLFGNAQHFDDILAQSHRPFLRILYNLIIPYLTGICKSFLSLSAKAPPRIS